MPDLREYKKKRDFKATPEPEGVKAGQGKHRFVVQKHDATRLHYDLRLEHKGVLLSWAVPKDPSTDPSVKRLAIQTEDHPVSYLKFEGIIPEGQYGAGNVIVWDIGTYQAPPYKKVNDLEKMLSEQYKKGHIHLFFKGKKLKGEYSLVRTDQTNRHWLFFKVHDKYAGSDGLGPESVLSGLTVDEVGEGGKARKTRKKKKKEPTKKPLTRKGTDPFPEPFSPMLATLTDKVFSSKDWIYEVKYDGYRCLVFKKGPQVTLYSRNKIVLNNTYPKLVEAVKEIPGDFVLDGEIIVADKTGGGSFALLQQYLRSGKKGPIRLVVFDLLYFEGTDTTGMPLIQRKQFLEELLRPVKNESIHYSDHVEEKGEQYLAAAHKLGLEGIIAKRRDSPYRKNKRTAYWLKMKNVMDEDLVVVGLTPSTTSERAFGALLLAWPPENGKLRFAGKTGTGFRLKQTFELRKKLEKIATPKPPVETDEKALFWVQPKYYAVIKYSEITNDKKLRHPVFMGLRDDKYVGDEPKDTYKKTTRAIPPTQENKTVSKVKLSNLDKVFFPKSNLLKGDIIAYYEEMSDTIIPYLRDRPMTLKRNPNGIQDKGFYQKDVQDVPSYVHTILLPSKSSAKEELNYAMCNNKSALIFLANWGCVEMHVWNSTRHHLDYPDHIVFDLDPQDNSFEEVKEAATALKEMLDSWNIHYGLKTSGGDGLHFYLPLVPQYTHEQVRNAAHIIGKLWLRQLPGLGSLERMPANRKKKIYLDYLQNAKGKTMAAPYSLRAKEQAPVSTPLQWEELINLPSPRELNIHTVPERIKKNGDTWKGLYRHRLKLETLVEKLER